MNNLKYLFISSIILTVILAILIPMSSANQNPILLKGFIIYTAESWGCLEGQEIREDVSTLISSADNNSATIQEIRNPEDVFNRYELYIIFPAERINGLNGSFAAMFRCESSGPDFNALLSVDEARVFQKEDQTWAIALKVKGNGFFTARMFYSQKPEMMRGWYSGLGARNQPPVQIQFYNVFPLEGDFGRMPPENLSGEWQNLELHFNPFFLEQSVAVDKCQALFEMLVAEFSVDGDSMLWKLEEITPETLQSLSQRAVASLGEQTFQVLLKLQDRRTLYSNLDNFVPHFRQPLAVRLSNGRLLGAEVWLRSGR